MYCHGMIPLQAMWRAAEWSRILNNTVMERNVEQISWFLRAHTCGNAQNKAVPKLSKLNLCGEEGSTLVKSVVGQEFNLL